MRTLTLSAAALLASAGAALAAPPAVSVDVAPKLQCGVVWVNATNLFDAGGDAPNLILQTFPDGNWVVFRSNMHGERHVYAVSTEREACVMLDEVQALYDAIWQFTDEKLRGVPGRRVIVLITDGDDTFSRARIEDAIDIAQRTETTIFGISTKAGFLGSVPGVEAGTVKDKGDRYLTRLCEATGGEAFFTGNMLDLERAFKRISDELRTQYIITYQPADQNYDGRERKIEVRFTDRAKAKDYKIRTKTSYRALRDELR